MLKERGGAGERVPNDRGGGGGIKAHAGSGIDHRLSEREEICRAGAGERGEGVHQRLIYVHDGADAAEEMLGEGGVCGRCRGAGAERGDAE